jgi:hypothetical protein
MIPVQRTANNRYNFIAAHIAVEYAYAMTKPTDSLKFEIIKVFIIFYLEILSVGTFFFRELNSTIFKRLPNYDGFFAFWSNFQYWF